MLKMKYIYQMKRILFLALTCLSILGVKSQNGLISGETFIFQGQIDNYPITMILDVISTEVKARYYYHKFGTIIELEGTSTPDGFTLETVSKGSTSSETFKLKIFHNELMGTWEQGSKSLPVNLVRNENPMEMYRVEKSIKASSVGMTKEEEKMAEIRLQYIWPTDASKRSDAIREFQFNQINSMQLGAENASATYFKVSVDQRTKQGRPDQLKSQMLRVADSFINQYQREVRVALRKKDFDLISSQNLFIHNTIIYESDRFLVLETGYYDYTGGAHGMFGRVHKTWDKQKNKWVEVNDLLTKTQQKKIPKAMTVNYKIATKIPQKSSLNAAGLWISEFDGLGGDTYFTDLGIHTSFGLYEIAPYSSGIIEVFVPWKDVK